MNFVLGPQLSPHLKQSEVRCKGKGCGCDGGGVVGEVVILFEAIRAACSRSLKADCAITIASGYRCPKHNRDIGGAKNSEHMKGKALDLRCPKGIHFIEFLRICEKENPNGGVGSYPSGRWPFVHVDVRKGTARWMGY